VTLIVATEVTVIVPAGGQLVDELSLISRHSSVVLVCSFANSAYIGGKDDDKDDDGGSDEDGERKQLQALRIRVGAGLSLVSHGGKF